jgi:hypothetical protein
MGHAEMMLLKEKRGGYVQKGNEHILVVMKPVLMRDLAGAIRKALDKDG